MRGEAGNVLGGGPKELVGGPGGGCKGVEAAGEPKVKGDAGKLLLVGVAIGTDPGGTKVEAIEVVEAVEAVIVGTSVSASVVEVKVVVIVSRSVVSS